MTTSSDPGALPSGRRWRRLLYPAGILLLGCCIVVLPCTQIVRNGDAQVRSAVSIRRIAQALRLYHEVYGNLPPALVADKNGKPLYSWRVALLPFLEHHHLYNQFKHNEPWDSPHNKKLLEPTPKCYLPALEGDDTPGLTRHQVFVGPGTAFERPGLTWDDFPNGPANTLLVVEAAVPAPWSKPGDLVYHPDRPLPPLRDGLTKPTHFLCYELWRTTGFNAGFGDGASRFIASKTSETTLRGLIVRNGPKVDASRFD